MLVAQLAHRGEGTPRPAGLMPRFSSTGSITSAATRRECSDSTARASLQVVVGHHVDDARLDPRRAPRARRVLGTGLVHVRLDGHRQRVVAAVVATLDLDDAVLTGEGPARLSPRTASPESWRSAPAPCRSAAGSARPRRSHAGLGVTNSVPTSRASVTFSTTTRVEVPDEHRAEAMDRSSSRRPSTSLSHAPGRYDRHRVGSQSAGTTRPPPAGAAPARARGGRPSPGLPPENCPTTGQQLLPPRRIQGRRRRRQRAYGGGSGVRPRVAGGIRAHQGPPGSAARHVQPDEGQRSNSDEPRRAWAARSHVGERLQRLPGCSRSPIGRCRGHPLMLPRAPAAPAARHPAARNLREQDPGHRVGVDQRLQVREASLLGPGSRTLRRRHPDNGQRLRAVGNMAGGGEGRYRKSPPRHTSGNGVEVASSTRMATVEVRLR